MEMNYKYPFFSLVLGIIALGLMPFGMSQIQTEPSMEIDMIAGQTQSPFRIQDENDVNVFEIDETGHPTIGHDVRQFAYSTEAGQEIHNVSWTLADITTPTHAGVLKYWELSYEDDTVIDSFPLIDSHGSSMSLKTKSDTGGDSCYFRGYYSNNNGASWFNLEGASTNTLGTAVWDVDTSWDAEASYLDVTDIRYVVYSSAGLDNCSFKQLMANQLLHIPKWMTITEHK